MPTYNSELFIKESIKSIQEQTHINWELLITDDCSTDNTISVIHSIQKTEKRIKLFQLSENRGSGYSRNNSIKMAQGEYIAFCDSDDIWLNNKLEAQLHFMLLKNFEFTFTNLSFINESSVIIKNRLSFIKEEVWYSDLLHNNYIPTSTVIISKELISNYKFPNYRKKQDYILWLAILKKENTAARYFDKTLTLYRKHKDQTTNNKLKLITLHYEILRVTQRLSIFKSIYFTFTWGLLGFYKHFLKNE